MPELKFTEDGLLEPGLYTLTANEFISFYCDKGVRKGYKDAVINVFDFAKAKNATRIIVGGSFVTRKENPHDLDCLIVFPNDALIPTFIDCAQMDEVAYDILYTSEQTPNSIDTFIRLMQTDVYGFQDKGVVEVKLCDKLDAWKIHFEPSDEDMEIIKRTYCNRTFIERNKRRGVLVVVHGINTNAAWLSNLIPAANSQGWIVAPFIYNNPVSLLFTANQRDKVIEDFRDFIYKISRKYEAAFVSVLAHSFGTYIVTRYVEGFSSEIYLPVRLENIVFTGSIINPEYDWSRWIPDKVGRVLNIVAMGDDAVKFMPKGDWKSVVGIDKLCGKAAIDGFTNISSNVINRPIEILNHSNIFKDDFIEQILLPYLNANGDMGNRDAIQGLRKKD